MTVVFFLIIVDLSLCGCVEVKLNLLLVQQLSGVAPPPLCRNAQVFLNAASSDGSMKSNLNLAVQAPRRKFMDEGKLRKVTAAFCFALMAH